jgi:hypothetical protein
VLLKEEEERKGCYYDSLSSLSSSIMGRILSSLLEVIHRVRCERVD